MIIINSKLEDLDDRISEYESHENYPKKVAIKNGVCDDEILIITEPGWRITDKDLIAIKGEYRLRNKDTQECEADWNCTLLYENTSDDEFDPEDWICLEQGPPTSAIHNCLRAVRE